MARLKQDYIQTEVKDPVPYIVAEPCLQPLLEWHTTWSGSRRQFKNGLYHGKLVSLRVFPQAPSTIYMTTPNGRFKTDTRLCLSISDYHPDMEPGLERQYNPLQVCSVSC